MVIRRLDRPRPNVSIPEIIEQLQRSRLPGGGGRDTFFGQLFERQRQYQELAPEHRVPGPSQDQTRGRVIPMGKEAREAQGRTQKPGRFIQLEGLRAEGRQQVPASIRFNNPGAQYPGAVARRFGSRRTETIGGGHKIAVFDTPEQGAAAYFGLLDKVYRGKTLEAAIKKWSGGNENKSYLDFVTRATGLTPQTRLTPELLRDPQRAIPLAMAQAHWEAGQKSPVTTQQWQMAHQMAFGGGQTQVAQAQNVPLPQRPKPNPAAAAALVARQALQLPPLPQQNPRRAAPQPFQQAVSPVAPPQETGQPVAAPPVPTRPQRGEAPPLPTRKPEFETGGQFGGEPISPVAQPRAGGDLQAMVTPDQWESMQFENTQKAREMNAAISPMGPPPPPPSTDEFLKKRLGSVFPGPFAGRFGIGAGGVFSGPTFFSNLASVAP